MGANSSTLCCNFAVYASDAEQVKLRLFSSESDEKGVELSLFQTGDIWHGEVNASLVGKEYTYLVKRKWCEWELLDPYAKLVAGPKSWRSKEQYRPRGVIAHSSFDWEDVSPPRHRFSNLVIYEAHVRGFTADPSSGVTHPGTYLGLIEKIPYLKQLGINAIELLPCQEFWEGEYQKVNPETNESLCNYWGYSTVNYFSPMSRYASDPSLAIDEFKMMVRELHRAGIEVILDVVYNHTAEGDASGPTISFRGFDPHYYLLSSNGDQLNFSGCGNTFNCNYPVAQDLILDSLRYWHSEMGVDGFRFDLASILGRGEGGVPLSLSPLIDRLSRDPLLRDAKLVAEAWDAGGLYQVGNFYPQYGRWSEWNGKYRDTVRRFIKGDLGQAGALGSAVCGSEELYSGRHPSCSVNFITAHDGFSLRDLVTYHDKHNEANGEESRDGCNENESWNCGVEGETDEPHIIALRDRQIRNFLSVLLLSQGVPMLHMGDEYGHTKNGNNNTWCQDNRLSWFQWDTMEASSALVTFTRDLIAFRRAHHTLRFDHFLTEADISWHDLEPNHPDWASGSRFVAWTLHEEGLYIAFSASHESTLLRLPAPPEGHGWVQWGGKGINSPYELAPYSSLILKAMPLG